VSKPTEAWLAVKELEKFEIEWLSEKDKVSLIARKFLA